MAKKITACRVCGNTSLHCILDLGEQALTGVFPKRRDSLVSAGPLRLVKCMGDEAVCGLVQLEHSYEPGEMYGDNYGYRSGLNASMVEHLHRKVAEILQLVRLTDHDLVVDIGSNDSTTLQAYPAGAATLVGVDPTAEKFRGYYPAHIRLIPDFFSAQTVAAHFPGRKARIITSFSMFYDLEDPLQFMRSIHELLADDGIWVFEQSYLPAMLQANSYDTVCHEHIEYYALRQIKWMADRTGFDILGVEFNEVNGGSFSVTACKARGGGPEPAVRRILEQEREAGLDSMPLYEAFAGRVARSREELLAFLATAREAGKSVAALGASTKGNVLLQYCGLGEADIVAVGEVNQEKFGCYTPGSRLPIKPESEVLAANPDYLLVLPWHFRRFFLGNPKLAGRNLLFPLPQLSVERVAGDGA